MIHTVIFDVGGTLVRARSSLVTFADWLAPDNDENLRKELLEFLINEFMKIYRDDKRIEFIGIKEIIAIVLKKAADKFNVKDISDKADVLYGEAYLSRANLFYDTVPTLKKLKGMGIKLIIASDADPDVLDRELTKFKIKKYFDEIIISGNIKAYKPSDKMTNAIKDKCNKPYSGILFVGDTEVDVLAAKKIGAKSVLINRNGDFQVEADYQIKKLDKICDIIENN